jgi:hexokinase
MIVNTEWGGFKAVSLPRLPADEAVDAQSVNPGWQTFEKLISGLYLGRITAQLLLRADGELESPLFDAETRAKLAQPGAFPTPLVAAVDSDRRVRCKAAAC